MKQILIALLLMAAPKTLAQDGSGEAMTEAHMMALVSEWTSMGNTLKTEADIPAVLELLHPDFTYIHTEYDANFDQEGLVAGLKGRLQRNWTKNEKRTITNRITGKNMVVIKFDSEWDDQRTGEWKHETAQDHVTLFEFRAGKIWRITEFWE
ncbi:MAG: hypothetical protein HWE25_03070 [Alphaproteobacteria bacterium]|nr:hypothetical protein [Alphaproteobacteria bacterium]